MNAMKQHFANLTQETLTTEWQTYADIIGKLLAKCANTCEKNVDPIYEITHALNILADEGKAEKRSPVRGNGFPIAFRLAASA